MSKTGEKDRKITNFIEISLFFSFWALSPKNSNRYSSFVFRATDPIFSDKLLMGYTTYLSNPDFRIYAFDPPFGRKADKGGQNAEIPKSGSDKKNVFPISSLSEKMGFVARKTKEE